MIYMDYNATTPLDSRVLEEMRPYFTDIFGNAASRQHASGMHARQAIETARGDIAHLLGARDNEIVFTSGATESCNLAIKGVYHRYQRKGRHLVVPVTEHKAVLDSVNALEQRGAEVTRLRVDSNGLVDVDALEEAIRPDTVLVCVMWANNETGVIQPMEKIGEICTRNRVLLFTDATQAVGKIAVEPRTAGVQLLAFSAHKFCGPKGVGGLYISQSSPQVKLEPLIHGGGHEGGVRSGTVNVPGVVGLAEALKLAVNEMGDFQSMTRNFRDRIETAFGEMATINAAAAPRLTHVSNVCFPGLDGPALMEVLKTEVAIASGSACTSADPEPSHVLMGMGLSRMQANASLRISLGRFTTAQEVETAIRLINDALRAQSIIPA